VEGKRLVVTLQNGRSHVLRLPESVAPDRAALVLAGLQTGAEAGWPEADEREWLRFDQGDGWLRRSAVVEVELVDWAEEPTEIY
jgi:hypothetical protein